MEGRPCHPCKHYARVPDPDSVLALFPESGPEVQGSVFTVQGSGFSEIIVLRVWDFGLRSRVLGPGSTWPGVCVSWFRLRDLGSQITGLSGLPGQECVHGELRRDGEDQENKRCRQIPDGSQLHLCLAAMTSFQHAGKSVWQCFCWRGLCRAAVRVRGVSKWSRCWPGGEQGR